MQPKKARDVKVGDRIVGKGQVIAVEGPPANVRGYGWYDEAAGLGETVNVKSDTDEVEVEDGD